MPTWQRVLMNNVFSGTMPVKVRSPGSLSNVLTTAVIHLAVNVKFPSVCLLRPDSDTGPLARRRYARGRASAQTRGPASRQLGHDGKDKAGGVGDMVARVSSYLGHAHAGAVQGRCSVAPRWPKPDGEGLWHHARTAQRPAYPRRVSQI